MEIIPVLTNLVRCSLCHRRRFCAQILLATHGGEQTSPVCSRCLKTIWNVEVQPSFPASCSGGKSIL